MSVSLRGRGSRERYPRAISQQALARSQVAIARLRLPACSARPTASRSQARRLPGGYRSAQACDVTAVTRALVQLSTLDADLGDH
jgi:hypothetical protein